MNRSLCLDVFAVLSGEIYWNKKKKRERLLGKDVFLSIAQQNFMKT